MWIFLYLDISVVLLEAICLSHKDSDGIQPLDYKNIPFHCGKCHEHDHMFRYCILNIKPPLTSHTEKKYEDGFTRALGRRRQNKKSKNLIPTQDAPVQNKFSLLSKNHQQDSKDVNSTKAEKDKKTSTRLEP